MPILLVSNEVSKKESIYLMSISEFPRIVIDPSIESAVPVTTTTPTTVLLPIVEAKRNDGGDASLEFFSQALHILSLDQDPLWVNVPLEDVRYEQVQLIQGRCRALGAAIRRHLVEIGGLIVEGQKLNLHQFAGHDSMGDWAREGMGLDNRTIAEATQLYSIWHMVRIYGFGHQEIVASEIDMAKKRMIEEVAHSSHQQIEQRVLSHLADMRAKSGQDVKLSDLSSDQRERLYTVAQQECEALIQSEIRHILETPTPVLKDERSISSLPPERVQIVIYDARWSERTQTVLGKICFSCDEEGMEAMQRGLFDIRFKSSSSEEYMTPQQFGRHLQDHLKSDTN